MSLFDPVPPSWLRLTTGFVGWNATDKTHSFQSLAGARIAIANMMVLRRVGDPSGVGDASFSLTDFFVQICFCLDLFILNVVFFNVLYAFMYVYVASVRY